MAWITFFVTILLWVTESITGINSNIVALIPLAVYTCTGVFGKDDIKEIKLLKNSDTPIGCHNYYGGVIVITTRKDSGLRDLELNGVYTTKRKRIGLAELSCKTYLNDAIEKRWKIKNIKSIQIHPEGKTVVDRKGRSHTVFISIETK